jgi:hypothetical protein
MKEKYRKESGERKVKIIRKGGDDRKGRERKEKRKRQKIEEKLENREKDRQRKEKGGKEMKIRRSKKMLGHGEE